MAKQRSRWKCGLRLWLENDGEVVLGRGRVALLEVFERERSISRAAARLKMSYRRAWLLVRNMNAASHTPLVQTATGGKRGGGTYLTANGKKCIATFRELEQVVQAAADRFVKTI